MNIKAVNIMKPIVLMILIIFIYNPSVASEETSPIFKDVPMGHWSYDFVHELYDLGITQGVGNDQFGLGETITRAEFVGFLVNLMAYDVIDPNSGSFSDNQDTNSWYFSYIETALENEVIHRTSHFRPTEPITREEMAIMIVRALGYDTLGSRLSYLPQPFKDVTENIGYISIAKDFGIISGTGNDLFKPSDYATREESAVMMVIMKDRLNNNINELHGFYAIHSSNQMAMINELDSVGFGWSRVDFIDDEVVVNTSRDNHNEFAIPSGFDEPLTTAIDSGATTQLMVFANQQRIIDPKTEEETLLLEYILTNDEVKDNLIRDIMDEVKLLNTDTSLEFDGVVIDFEEMRGEALAQAFNVFLRDMKEALDPYDKSLYVAVHPARRPGQTYYDGYDFKGIGEVADKVILMAHDYYAKSLTDTEMARGYTNTPLTPLEEIYYALRAITDDETGIIDTEKIWLQFSFDAVQWKLEDNTIINRRPYSPSYEAIYNRLQQDVELNYSNSSENPFVRYYDENDDTNNVLWYEDARSIQAKMDLAKTFGIEGISLWRLGTIPDFDEVGEKEVYLNIWQTILDEVN
ncbi:S-layer family protein [Natranaerovirga hydrolytica]|uniref:S-layer family protein n=1 Tax=Natranaerovirga hydrolytica TaxID=680378 RepID=A0A4V2Q1L4_9FIRM|nr:S-layer homology domain-containing protein [Natranaerovirga hydrolytica]TCK98071.1 S-layer family protein [Natranaerovirga hydrolytica]